MSSEEGSGIVGTYESMTDTVTFVCVTVGAGGAPATAADAAGPVGPAAAAAAATFVLRVVDIFAVVERLYGFFVWLHLPS